MYDICWYNVDDHGMLMWGDNEGYRKFTLKEVEYELLFDDFPKADIYTLFDHENDVEVARWTEEDKTVIKSFLHYMMCQREFDRKHGY